jgi:hypothetical protein
VSQPPPPPLSPPHSTAQRTNCSCSLARWLAGPPHTLHARGSLALLRARRTSAGTPAGTPADTFFGTPAGTPADTFFGTSADTSVGRIRGHIRWHILRRSRLSLDIGQTELLGTDVILQLWSENGILGDALVGTVRFDLVDVIAFESDAVSLGGSSLRHRRQWHEVDTGGYLDCSLTASRLKATEYVAQVRWCWCCCAALATACVALPNSAAVGARLGSSPARSLYRSSSLLF